MLTKIVLIFFQTYVLCTIFLLLCVVLLWKYLRIWYYLSKVPGPKGYPIIGNALLIRDMLQAEVYFKVVKKNGPFLKLWLGPIPVVLVSDPSILQAIYRNPNALDKGWIFQKFFNSIWKNSLVVVNVDEWKHNRKIYSHAFSPVILNSFLPKFNDISASLINELKMEVGKSQPFDILYYFRRATLDSICGTAMGIDTNSLQTPYSSYAQAMDKVLRISVKRLTNAHLYSDYIFSLTNFGKEQNKALKVIWDVTDKVFDTKLKLRNHNSNSIKHEYENLNRTILQNPLKKPFLEFMLDMMQLYPELTLDQLKGETNFNIIAGYETTAITLSYALLVLGGRRLIQQKALDEVFSIFGNSDKTIELEDLSELKYLEMVIKETLRLFPPVSHVMREASNDMSLGGYNIPAGTTIIISIVQTHRNLKYWKNPLEFIPERFLSNPDPYAFIPFSAPPRNCLGGRYAMMFMKLQLANILRKFEIHTDLNLDELKFEISTSLKLLHGHLITLTERR